jgi:CheY-like chemotaxis protein
MSVKMLVVDDEQDVEMLFNQRFRKSIRSGEITIHYAFSAEDAITYLNTLHPPDIALILSDINMPGMSGFDLLQNVKKEFPQIHVMMLSAYGDPGNQEKARTLGADDLLSKPLNFQLLEEKLSSLLQP